MMILSLINIRIMTFKCFSTIIITLVLLIFYMEYLNRIIQCHVTGVELSKIKKKKVAKRLEP